jgi:hypothetical protein
MAGKVRLVSKNYRDRVRIVRCPRCNRVYSVVPPQSEAAAKACHHAEYHADFDQPDGG